MNNDTILGIIDVALTIGTICGLFALLMFCCKDRALN
jgi:hypothetical protein